MEVESYSVLDEKMDEGYARYMRLHAIVEEINARPVSRTAEWYAEHNALLKMYTDYFKGGFEDINPEITDLEFRSNCKKLDGLVAKLTDQYRNYGWFSLYDYLQFNQIAISVVDTACTSMQTEEDDMSDMFSALKV